jgi:hypothetical protein
MSARHVRADAFGLYRLMVDSIGESVCFRCNRAGLIDLDHIVPLSWTGLDQPWNWQPLCPRCNANKGARFVEDWRPEPFRRQLLDIGMQLDPDMSEDSRWLSYRDLARLRRIDQPSAVKLATRNRWPRRKNNSGQMQVCVPLRWLEEARARRDRHTDMSADNGAVEAMFQVALQAKDATIAAKDAAIEALRGQIDVQAALVAELRVVADQAHGEAQEAQQRAERLEAADAHRRGQGRLRRAWAAWRGE